MAGPIRIRCVPDGTLEHLESSDAVALPVFIDERPLRGLAGLMDWRLHGMVSRLLLSGRFRGDFRDNCLLPGAGYLPVEKVFLFGMGYLAELDPFRCRELLPAMAQALEGVRAERQVWPLWDVFRGAVSPVEAADSFLSAGLGDELRIHGGAVTVVGGGTWGRSLREALRARAERGWHGPPLEIR